MTIRNVAPALKERLRVRAARKGHSMEAELRDILRDALADESNRELDLATAIAKRFGPLGGADELVEHPPQALGEPPRFVR
ncbi:MAG: plasmid stabilization protein [Beijerinckiaceae bacterium]